MNTDNPFSFFISLLFPEHKHKLKQDWKYEPDEPDEETNKEEPVNLNSDPVNVSDEVAHQWAKEIKEELGL